jgi:uroporphyrinogen-III decarboxylase
MTPRERTIAAFEGRPVDRFPTATLYHSLFVETHFAELTDLPEWGVYTLPYLDVDEHMKLYSQAVERANFDILDPRTGSSPRELRRRQEFIEKDGVPFRHDTETDEWFPLNVPTKSGHAYDSAMTDTRRIWNVDDIEQQITITKAADLYRSGQYDCVDAIVEKFGRDRFIILNGPSGALSMCTFYFGMISSLAMLVEEPGLIDHLAARTLEEAVEKIRRMAEVGVDGFYIWEGNSTAELISAAHYDRFCLPYTRALVEEAHRVGLKVILACYGDVMDRLESLAATGADGLQVECAMKGYTNDMNVIAETIGDRVTLMANIDPYWLIEKAPEETLIKEIRRLVEAGRKAKGFILSPASPITPGTSLQRVQRFIELCNELGTPG